MGLFSDLTKAFGSVRQEFLILNLEVYGVKSCILNWLKYYLHNRKQRVVLQFVNSSNLLLDWEIVRHGVRQGSVLGPLLFNMYINDFPCIINKISHTILFADGTNILVSSSDLNELNSKLNSVLCCISKWFQINQLVLNLIKIYIVKFASSKLLTYPLNFVYNSRDLTVTENIIFLSTHLDCNLIWKSHIDNIIQKTEFSLLPVKKIITHYKCESVMYGLFCRFYSHISYGIVFWGSSSSIRNVFIIQKGEIRIMLRLCSRSSCREGFKKLDILPVPCLYIYALVLFAVKNLNIYQINSSVHDMNKRQQNKLHIHSVRLSSIRRDVYFSSV